MMMTRLLSATGGCCLFEGEPIDRPQENGKVESIIRWMLNSPLGRSAQFV